MAACIVMLSVQPTQLVEQFYREIMSTCKSCDLLDHICEILKCFPISSVPRYNLNVDALTGHRMFVSCKLIINAFTFSFNISPNWTQYSRVECGNVFITAKFANKSVLVEAIYIESSLPFRWNLVHNIS